MSARESLAGLDGELQRMAWVARLPIAGQTTGRTSGMLDKKAVAARYESVRQYSFLIKAMGTREAV